MKKREQFKEFAESLRVFPHPTQHNDGNQYFVFSKPVQAARFVIGASAAGFDVRIKTGLYRREESGAAELVAIYV